MKLPKTLLRYSNRYADILPCKLLYLNIFNKIFFYLLNNFLDHHNIAMIDNSPTENIETDNNYINASYIDVNYFLN